MRKLILILLFVSTLLNAQALELMFDEDDKDFYSVTTFIQLQNAVKNANDGDTIQIENDIIYPSDGQINITKDIIIKGNNTTDYVKLSSTGGDEWRNFFYGNNCDITFKYIHIDGEDFSILRNGMTLVNGNYLIDSCIIERFGYCAVLATNSTTNLIISNSVIRNNAKDGYGYGINSATSANVTVDNCIFNNNRHHVTGGGTTSTTQPNITVVNSIFQKSTKFDYGTYWYKGSAIDLHGMAHYAHSLPDPDPNVWGDSIYAGNIVIIKHNTFQDDSTQAISIRGVPYTSAYIDSNTFAHDWMYYYNNNSPDYSYPAIAQYQVDYVADKNLNTAWGRLRIGNNFYSGGAPPFSYYDNARNFFQVQYDGDWNRLGVLANGRGAEDLLYGDFNGDGITDIITDADLLQIIATASNPTPIEKSFYILYSGSSYVIDGSVKLAKLNNYEVESDVTVNSNLYSSNFSAGTNGFTAFTNATITGNVDGVADSNDVIKLTASATSAVHFMYKQFGEQIGHTYRIKIDYYIPNDNDSVDGFKIGNSDLALTRITGVGTPAVIGEWTTAEAIVTVTNYANAYTRILAMNGANESALTTANDDVYFKNIKIDDITVPDSMFYNYDVADIDGDGKDDLIYNESTYSSGGIGEWTALPNAFNTYTLTTKRDFNGDGTNDSYRVSTE